MKKFLVLGTSALALGLGTGVAMADDQPANALKLTLGGGAVENFGYVDNPSGKNTGLDNAGPGFAPTTHGTSLLSFGDAWIVFDGKAKLDNGINVEVNMQLNGSGTPEGGNCLGNTTGGCSNKTEILNEADWIAFDGAFGRVEFGDDFNPAANYRFGNSSPYYGTSGMDWPRHTGWIVGSRATPQVVSNQEFAMMDDYNATKAIYQTPVFAGFQVSASYTPSIASGDAYNQIAAEYKDGGDQYTTMVAYKNTVGDVAVNADVDYGYEDLFNQSAVSGGLNLTYKGFDLGGAAIHRMVDNGSAVCGSQCAGASGVSYNTLAGTGTLWTVGLGYSNGPWGVAFSYAHDSAADSGNPNGYLGATVNGYGTLSNYALTGKYTIGPGVDLSLESGLLYYRVPDGQSQDQIDGGYVLAGTELTF